MKPKLIALNLLLAASVCAVVWQARIRWMQAQAERQANLNVRIKPVQPPHVSAIPKPEAPPAVKYADVANKNLFAADRNPTVIIDPPPAPPAPKPMPPLPIVYGTMSLPSGIKALMAEKSGEPSVVVHTGDTIGSFKVLALNSQKVTFEWNDKQVERRIEDLADRSGAQPGVSQGPAAPPPGPAAQPSISSSQPRGSSDAPAGRPGRDLSPTEKACSGDNAPPGTVVDGYVKQFSPSPFGPMNCHWTKQ